MSQTTIVVQGTVKADGTLELAEKLNVPAGPVQVVIQRLPDRANASFLQRLETIWAGQKARGHVPHSVEQIQAQRHDLNREMDEEILQAIKLQEECRNARSEVEHPREPRE